MLQDAQNSLSSQQLSYKEHSALHYSEGRFSSLVHFHFCSAKLFPPWMPLTLARVLTEELGGAKKVIVSLVS